MPKRDRTREALDALSAAVTDPRSDGARKALGAALKRKSNLLVQAAADTIASHELAGFEQALARAFASMMTRPVKSDPGCRAKLAIVRALDQLEVHDERAIDQVFVPGARHVQREPVWGATVDTAPGLRGACAMALVNARHGDVMSELAVLLADPEREARRVAADAIAVTGDTHAGVPLLLHRVTAGDPSTEVLHACCSALLSLEPRRRLATVTAWLDDADEARVEAAALALGGQRPPGAFEPLRDFVERCAGPLRDVGLLALAMLRSEPAWDYLIESVALGSDAEARGAIRALAVYRAHPGLGERLRGALAHEPDRRALVDEAFAGA